MKLDLQKAPIHQLKFLICDINELFVKQKREEDLPKFLQLNLKHLGKGQYSLTAKQYDSKNFKVIKTKELKQATRHIMMDYVFGKFFKLNN